MKYQFDIKLSVEVATGHKDREAAEAYMGKLCELATEDSLLDEKYPNFDYKIINPDVKNVERLYNLFYTFKIQVEDKGIGGDRIEVAERNVEAEVARLIKGSLLERRGLIVRSAKKKGPEVLPLSVLAIYTFSDEQPEIEEIDSSVGCATIKARKGFITHEQGRCASYYRRRGTY